MTTIVLVHGAWHGGWCWQPVLPYLHAEDHTVYAPALTGLGERSHLYSPSIDISCHVQDIVNVLFYEDLQDVMLVGHSYGGMIISGVAEKCPERLSQLVYLDAMVPQNGETIFDQLSSSSDVRPNAEEQAAASANPIPPSAPEEFGVTDPVIAKWMEERLTPHPGGTLFEPLVLTSKLAKELPRFYISCTVEQEKYMPSIAKVAARIRNEPNWNYRELETGHDAMLTAPKELAGLLNSIG